MVEEESKVVELDDDFYRDSLNKLIFVIASMLVGIGILVALAIYIYLDKPKPINFLVNEEMRVQVPIPLDKPYLSEPDLLQWVAEVVPQSFYFDFNHYNDQLKVASEFFTQEGWKIFLNQLNIYANYNNVQTYKLFINGYPAAAPVILKQGLLSGRYAWWVQMPVTIKYDGFKPPLNRTLTLQVLVVRVPTLNNLMGVGIENIIVGSNAINSEGNG